MARNRKKAKMDQLEAECNRLIVERSKITLLNKQLAEKNLELQQENERLRVSLRSHESSTIKSAELINGCLLSIQVWIQKISLLLFLHFLCTHCLRLTKSVVILILKMTSRSLSPKVRLAYHIMML